MSEFLSGRVRKNVCEVEKLLKFGTLGGSSIRVREVLILQCDCCSWIKVHTPEGNIRKNNLKVKNN